MNRRTFLSAGAIALGTTWSPVWADEDTNAVQHYRKAVLLLPKLTEAEDQLIESLPAAPFNVMGLDLIRRSEAALREMTRGAALKDCDWGVDYFAKFLDLDMFPMVKISRLARLACLRARYCFHQNESLSAIADLGATLRMARHISRRGPWMATIVQLAIELSVIDVAAAHLPQQNAKTVRALAASLEALPKSCSLSESTRGEKEFLLQSIRPQYENKNSQEALKLLRKPYEFTEEEVNAILKTTRGDVKELLKMIDDAARLEDELAGIAALARAEFRPALSAFQKKHPEPNPFMFSIDGLEGVRYAVDRTEVRFAMLHAAIKVVLCGTEQLNKIKDPFGNGPFKYRSFDGGFELESSLQFKDRPPVTVTVGSKKKE